MNFGVNTWVWTAPLTTEELEVLAPKIAKMDFIQIEIPIDDPKNIDFTKCREIITKAGINSISCRVAMGPDRDLIDPDPKVRQNGIDYVKANIDAARQYIESFVVYGSEMSFEWQLVSNEEPVVQLGGEDAKHAVIKEYPHFLPDGIREFTTKCVDDMAENKHLPFIQGFGHGGSQPHLANEFLSAILQDRAPFPNVFESANRTSVDILAHESAMQGGKLIQLTDHK